MQMVTVILYYIFHHNFSNQIIPEVNSCPILIKFVSAEVKINVVIHSYLQIFV